MTYEVRRKDPKIVYDFNPLSSFENADQLKSIFPCNSLVISEYISANFSGTNFHNFSQ